MSQSVGSSFVSGSTGYSGPSSIGSSIVSGPTGYSGPADIVGNYCFNRDGSFNNLNGNCSAETVSIYVLNQNLKNAMDRYNTLYACCNNSVNTEGCDCSNENILTATVELNDAVVAYNNALTYIARNVIGSDNQGLYGDILKQRATMDSALDILKNNKDPRYQHYKSQYDYVIYVSILWGVLAARLLYYVFVEL